MSYRGDYLLGSNVDFDFTTLAPTTGVPTTLSGTPVLSAYVGNSTTEITAGITLSVDFDSRTGMNHVRVAATTGNGFAAQTDVDIVITTGTVAGNSAVGYVVGSFSIENRTANVTRVGSVSVTTPVGAIPGLGIVDSGTLQSATGTTAVIRSAASFGDGTLVGHFLWIISGTGVGQSRYIGVWVNSTKTATVDTWTVTPDSTSGYIVVPTPPGSLTSLVPVDVRSWNGTAVATPATAGVPDVNAKAVNNVPTTSVTQVNANQGTTQPLNFTGTSTSALVKVDMIDIASAAVSTTTAQLGVNAVQAGGTAWNSGAINLNTLDPSSGLKPIRAATAQAGATSSITFDAGASATTDFYINDYVVTTGGTGAGQARFVTAYNGSTKVATVARAWATNPDSSTTFVVIPFDAIPGATAPTAATIATTIFTDLMSGSDFNTAGSFGALIKADVDAAISSRLAPVTPGTTIAVGANHAVTIDIAAVLNPSTSLALSGTVISQATSAPSTGDLTTTQKTSVSAAVLDVLASDHNSPNTIGAKINQAGSSTDPLTNTIGTYTGTQIGTLIQNSAQAAQTIKADVRNINGVPITGAGVAGNPFQP